MTKLSEKYSDKPVEEYPMLFQRILQNTIRDYYRRQKIRNFWTTPLSSLFSGKDGEDDTDPLELIPGDPDSSLYSNPAKLLENAQTVALVEEGLKILPTRQREAFLLRYWEDMDVATTAEIMGCTGGSVKTHCSRAVHALAAFLRQKGVEL
jgi:RNA polymerase sigma-70 factor (ECF subfamily)